MNRQVDIEIMGRNFTLSVPSEEEALLQHAQRLLNQKIAAVQEQKQIMENDKILTIAALNAVYDVLSTQDGRGQVLAIETFGRTIDEIADLGKKALNGTK